MDAVTYSLTAQADNSLTSDPWAAALPAVTDAISALRLAVTRPWRQMSCGSQDRDEASLASEYLVTASSSSGSFVSFID